MNKFRLIILCSMLEQKEAMIFFPLVFLGQPSLTAEAKMIKIKLGETNIIFSFIRWVQLFPTRFSIYYFPTHNLLHLTMLKEKNTLW